MYNPRALVARTFASRLYELVQKFLDKGYTKNKALVPVLKDQKKTLYPPFMGRYRSALKGSAVILGRAHMLCGAGSARAIARGCAVVLLGIATFASPSRALQGAQMGAVNF